MATLAAASSSSRSSTCQPGHILMRYSEMLLAPKLAVAEVVEAAGTMGMAEKLYAAVTGSGAEMGAAEKRTPVRRNLLCFMVRWLALCMEASQAPQRIALSSRQNRTALFSYKSYHRNSTLSP